MSNYNPASILFDQQGNPVGVILDDSGNYRLQVQSLIADKDGEEASIDIQGNRVMLATSDQHLLAVAQEILGELRQVKKHLETITGEEDPL
jgi:hypothetical protein